MLKQMALQLLFLQPPENFFVERRKDFLKMAGVNYRAEMFIRAATAIKKGLRLVEKCSVD